MNFVLVDSDLLDCPQVFLIAVHADIEPDEVVGKLIKLFLWFHKDGRSGRAPTFVKYFLDDLLLCNGFCDAVIESGLMADDDDYICLLFGDKIKVAFDAQGGKNV